jgi:hypothetical protein
MEAYGRETTLPWAITVYEAGKGYIHVHPTFLYESIWDILVFLLLILLIDKKKKFDGQNNMLVLYSLFDRKILCRRASYGQSVFYGITCGADRQYYMRFGWCDRIDCNKKNREQES